MLEFSTNLRFNLPADGSFPGEWGDPLNANFITIDDLFGPQGHDHSGEAGMGPKLNHANLLGIGINSHDAIDAHMACLDLHQDIQIGAVIEEGGGTYLNVSELRFANSTVTSLGSGVVVVTPTGGGGGTPLEQSAPVVHYDAFSAPVGTPLTKQNYIVFSGGGSPPAYVSSSEGGVDVGDITVGAGVSGFCTNLLDGFHPHSIVQRVGVVVAEHQPTTPLSTDNWELQLHLLASDRPESSSLSSPVRAGVSLRLRVQDGVTTPVLNLDIRAQAINGLSATYSTPFPAPSGFDGSVWNGLPYQYINGHHEFSLSIPPNNPNNFYLNYYYNSGLIFRHEFTSGDSMHAAVMSLVDDLKLVDAPTGQDPHLTPDFGRVGWSMSYNFASTSGTFRSNIKAVMASSTGEQETPRVVELPDGVETAVQVCGGTGPASGTVVGGDFDPDADGPLYGNWTVDSTLAAGANGFTAAGAGFVISDGGTTRNIYCDLPQGQDATNGNTVSPGVCIKPLFNDPLTLRGIDLPPAEFADIKFFPGSGSTIKDEWYLGGVGSAIGENTELPLEFLTLDSSDTNGNSTGNAVLENRQGSPNQPTQYTARIRGGGRLPFAQKISVKITSKYNPAYNTTITDAFTICRNQPNLPGTPSQTFRFDPTLPDPTAAVDQWVPLGGGTICEGEYFAFFFNGQNLSIGENFWSGGNRFVSPYWGIEDTTYGGTQAITVPGSTFQILDSRFYRGRFRRSGGDVLFLGQDPSTGSVDGWTVIPQDNSDVELNTQEGLLVLGRLNADAWSPGTNADIKLLMDVPGSTQEYTIVTGAQIKPHAPVIDTGSGTIDDRTAGGTPTISFEVDYPDDDFTVYFDGGGWQGANVGVGLTTGDTGVTVVSVGGFEQRERWTIDTSQVTGLTLDSAASVSILVYGKNEAAFAAFGAANGQSNNLGYDSTDETPDSTPVLDFKGPFVLYEDAHSGNVLYANLNIWIEDATLEANPTAELLDASDDSVVTDRDFRGLFLEEVPTPPSIPAGSTSYVFQTAIVNFAPFTGAGALPAAVKLRITNPEGGFADTPAITVDQMPIPSISRVSLDQVGVNVELPAAGIDQFGTLDVYVDVQDPFRYNVSQTQFELVFTDELPLGSAPTLQGFVEDGDLGSNLYRYRLTLANLGGISGGDTVGVKLVSTSLGGQVFETTSSDITFTSSISVDSETSTIPDPVVGRYVGIDLRGDFQASDYSTTDTNITVDLFDSAVGGNSLISGAMTVSQFSAEQIFFTGRMADNLFPGNAFWIEVNLVADGVTERVPSGTAQIVAPPVPLIDNATFSSLTAGASGVTLTIEGDNLGRGGPGTIPPGPGSPLDFGYTLLPESAFTNPGALKAGTFGTDNLVEFEGINISSAAQGTALSIRIDYLGGYTIDLPLNATVGGAGGGTTPGTSGLTTDGDEESGGDPGQFRSSGSTTTFTISGSGLGSENVATDDGSSPVQLVVAGFSNNAGGDLPESPPGAALHPDVTNKAFTDVTIVSQSDTEIVARATLSNIFVDTKLRVRLSRPASHPDGAGYWTDEEIDLITPGDETHPGMTLDGPSTTLLAPNSIPSVGSTRRDFATAFQTALGPNSDGSTFSVTLRLTQALTQAPVVVAVPDPTYGATLSGITVTPTASPFEWQISGRVPTPSQVNGYPASTWRAAFPVSVGLTLRNGIPIASAVLGSPLTLSPGGGGATPIP